MLRSVLQPHGQTIHCLLFDCRLQPAARTRTRAHRVPRCLAAVESAPTLIEGEMFITASVPHAVCVLGYITFMIYRFNIVSLCVIVYYLPDLRRSIKY